MEKSKFLGVCYGISEKYDFDVTILRVGFIILAILGPIKTLIFYFLLSMIFPENSDNSEYIE